MASDPLLCIQQETETIEVLRANDVKTYRISVAKGDGIGPEIVSSTLDVLEKLQAYYRQDVCIELKEVLVGWEAYNKFANSLPEESIRQMESVDGLILGPLSLGTYPPSDPGGPSPSGKIRKHFDLYANIRPTISYGFNKCYPKGKVDLVIVRENTEGFYADRNMFEGNGEFKPNRDVALSVRVINRESCRRVIRAAFELAKHRSGKVTAVHKGNVLKMTDGLFLEEFKNTAQQYSSIQADDKIVDTMAYELVLHPERYDVIVTTNMYGDILTDEAAAIAGSLGLAPSLNAGENYAMAQAAHGSAPDIAGKGIANPLAEIMSLNMLLDWFAQRNNDVKLLQMSKTLRNALKGTIDNTETLTPDMGGKGTTVSITKLVIEKITEEVTKKNAKTMV